MLLMYYDIKVKSLCVWGSQNFSSDKYVPRYLIHQRLNVKRKTFGKKNFFLENFFFLIYLNF